MRRRDWLRAALALPLGAPLRRLTAAVRGKVKITGIQIKPISRLSHTLIRIDTDAGVSGFGESGVNGEMARAWLGRSKPLPSGEDTIAIHGHFNRNSAMMHAH